MATRSEVRTRQATRSTVASLTRNDLQNRNFLQPQGFRFQVARAPKVTFFGNSVNILMYLPIGYLIASLYKK